jgi:hypothetical protein
MISTTLDCFVVLVFTVAAIVIESAVQVWVTLRSLKNCALALIE